MPEVKLKRRNIRRNVEQIIHCAKEAYSVLQAMMVTGNQEDVDDAIEDLKHAKGLIDHVLPVLVYMRDAGKKE